MMETARYRLVAFMRIEPEDTESLTYAEALSEKEQQELISPENLYRIEDACYAHRPVSSPPQPPSRSRP
jgi:hypothetical protein